MVVRSMESASEWDAPVRRDRPPVFEEEMMPKFLPWFVVAVGMVGAGMHSPVAVARILHVDGSGKAENADGSRAAPYPTIAAAAAVAEPGDDIMVHQGIYRERVVIPAGQPSRPITVRCARGEHAVLTACDPITGWQKAGGGVWAATIDWKPQRLFVGRREQPAAREPNEGWWRAASAANPVITDPRHVPGIAGGGSLGQAYVWFQRGNLFGSFAIRAIERSASQLVLDGFNRYQVLSDGDKYYLVNRRAYIDRPGEWAVEPVREDTSRADGPTADPGTAPSGSAASRYRVFFLPHSPDELGRVEAPRRDRSLITVRGGHVRIAGLEIMGSRHMGIEVRDAEDVEIRDTIVHHCASTGISLRATSASTVAHNIAWRNGNGISVSYSRRVTIEENDVGYNRVDGILVTWQSDQITVQRNYVHHHLLWGHPDNMQVYRGVTGARFLDNVLLAAGQSVMMEQTRDGEFAGNMVVGSGAYMLIFGHGNAGHYRIHNNTFALAGYGCMNLTWEAYDVRENVFMSGHESALYGTRGIDGYTADRNVFFNTSRSSRPMILATDDGWLRDFDAVRASTGQDAHSIYADPRFRNAPVAFRVLDSRRLDECSRDRWYLRGGTSGWRVGDLVEVNFDGVRRRIVAVQAQTITVEPGLAEAPLKGWLVANWGDQDDFQLDLRLAADSPGARLSATGGPVGSTLDVQAYRAGDFDADGRRDLPTLPLELKAP